MRSKIEHGGQNDMPIADKEFVLNYTTNRWGLNKKVNVGATSDSIRLCAPSSIQEWTRFYYENVRSREQIDAIGRRLFDKVRNVLPDEKRFYPELLESISEEDCIAFIHNLVINRQYEGYLKENGR